MAKLCTVDGIVIDVLPANGKSFSYDELKMIVHGTIDIVPLPSGKRMVINDNGKLDGLSVNIEASKLWRQEYPIDQFPINNDETIVGNVLVATDEELGDEEEENKE